MTAPWLEVQRGTAPLIVSFPHTGIEIPADIECGLQSGWLARKDTDWHIERLYDFAADLGATTIRTAMSRTVIDVNRSPVGSPLYPGQFTTALCPLTTFDGEALYQPGHEPGAAESARRRKLYFEPYHAALKAEIDRLKSNHATVVLYDAHAIRSEIPRLFEGTLPHFNIGTEDGRTADFRLSEAIQRRCASSCFTTVTNGRFKGGWTVRHYGAPKKGIHAVQMELACRSYMDETKTPDSGNWPPEYSSRHAAKARTVLQDVLSACLKFCR